MLTVQIADWRNQHRDEVLSMHTTLGLRSFSSGFDGRTLESLACSRAVDSCSAYFSSRMPAKLPSACLELGTS